MTGRLTRRKAISVAAALAAPSLIPLRARELTGGDSELQEFLQRFVMRLFPHADVPQRIYARVAQTITSAAINDGGLLESIETGRAALDRAAGMPWINATPEAQTEAIAALDETAFFASVRAIAAPTFYGDPEVWAQFGYQGPSFDKGGYLTRGFGDLDWLPRPKS